MDGKTERVDLMANRRRNPLPTPPEFPDGHMLFYRRIVPISQAEQFAKHMMSGFDDLPPKVRFALNCAPEYPHKAAELVRKSGEAGAARRILKQHWGHVFKTRDRTGARP
jgi:hypothetical protein